MKFQDSSFNGLKVTVGTESVTHTPTDAPNAICPINFFQNWGHKNVHTHILHVHELLIYLHIKKKFLRQEYD